MNLGTQKVRAEKDPSNQSPLPVIIVDNGLEIKIETYQATVKEVLEDLKIKLDEGSLIFPDLGSKIGPHYRIFIYSREEPKPLDLIKTYRVKKGDTLSSLAKKFNITWNTIKWVNNLESLDEINPGQDLIILPISGILHEVKKDEDLDKIANRYKADKKEIIEYNKIKNPEKLEEGAKIIVPKGKILEVSKPKIEQLIPQPKPKVQVYPKKPSKESKPEGSGKTIFGTASWYSWKKGMGCASLKFPLGTKLRITNVKSSASIEVVVFDRGPYNSRIIDLTKEAFSKIAHLGSGVIKVKVEEIK